MRFFLPVLIGLLINVGAVQQTLSQSAAVPLNSRTYHQLDRLDIQGGNLDGHLHTTTKPYRRTEVVDRLFTADSAGQFITHKDRFNREYLINDNSELTAGFAAESAKPFLKHFFKEPGFLYQVDEPSFTLRLNPVIHWRFGGEDISADLPLANPSPAYKYINSRGAELRGSIDNKVAFYLFATDNLGRFMQHVHDRGADRFQVMPGEGRTKAFRDQAYDYFAVRGYINFDVSRHINLQFGQDKLFIGDGYRSLILSDVGKDFLHLKLNTRVWRFEYQNIFAELSDYRQENIRDMPIRKKYAAIHHLGLNVTKNFHVGIFEGIIFGGNDSIPRGFELHYLNPMIFYRSVEFNLGSVDNVMMGLNWKWNIRQRASFYGQLMLDEFNFTELRANTGWWANKYGLQAGIKYIDAFGLSNLDLQAEMNVVRPYTYSHFEVSSSYTHFSQPLAHPLGANFNEFVGIVRAQPVPKLDLTAKLIYANFGADPEGMNYGGNIFLDNDDRVTEYGNSLGQGLGNVLLTSDLSLSYMVKHNLFADLRMVYRDLSSEDPAADRSSLFAALGVRWNIAQRVYDF